MSFVDPLLWGCGPQLCIEVEEIVVHTILAPHNELIYVDRAALGRKGYFWDTHVQGSK